MGAIRVDLTNLDGFAGVIIAKPTGVIYANQTGGTHCCQEQLEGFFIPLVPYGVDDEDPLRDYSEKLGNYPTPISPERSTKLLELGYQRVVSLSLRQDLEVLPIRDSPTHSFREAWIPVRVKDRTDGIPELAGVKGHIGILTYQNSD